MLSAIYADRHLCYVTYEPFMLSVILLIAIMLSVVMLNVVVPFKKLQKFPQWHKWLYQPWQHLVTCHR
jgi:hypothetical protein